MDIKPIIVREYLESLTEDGELDYIFPLFLESQGFIILSKPTESKGVSQYGKDVVAVGVDFEDGIEKRFYFELKGGGDRHITPSTYAKEDGVRMSLYEAKDRKFEFTNKEHEKLPLKIVLVHNGELKASIKDTFEGFIRQHFPPEDGIEFDRWGISELTRLFSERFFGEYLLVDRESTRLFNKTLVNLDAEDGVSVNFIRLLDVMFGKMQKECRTPLSREWKMLFESLRLVGFIVYTEAKSYNNLDIAKRYLTCLVLRFWYWILKHKLEANRSVTAYFDKVLHLYTDVMAEYFQRTLPVANLPDGLYAEAGGTYEQLGYTFRTFGYIQYLCWFIKVFAGEKNRKEMVQKLLVPVLNHNSVSGRPLLDIHSIPVTDVLLLLIEVGELQSARNYLYKVLSYIKLGKEKYGRMPDANNQEKSVIKFILTKEKPIYYSDTTSLLLAVLMEFTAILDMGGLYNEMKAFIHQFKIDLGIFVPHHGEYSTSKNLIENPEDDLEEQLFSKEFFNDGYQRSISLYKGLEGELSFEDFRQEFMEREEEFTYIYHTDKAGFSYLSDLAHIYFRTPYFPDKWRGISGK